MVFGFCLYFIGIINFVEIGGNVRDFKIIEDGNK